MKLILIFFCSIFFSKFSCSQYLYESTNQPDSIYNINRVKSKSLRHPNDRVSIRYDFNSNGKLIAESHLLKNGKLLSKKSMYYNSAGKLIKEYAQVFFKIDSTKNISFDSIELDRLTPFITEIAYNNRGALERKTTLNHNNQKISEEVFTYNPFQRIEKQFHYSSASYDSIVIQYEKPNYFNRTIHYLVDSIGAQKMSELTASNYFNQDGNITKRIIFKLVENSPVKTKEEYFEYNKSGLIIVRTDKTFYKGKEMTKKLYFYYEYW